MFEGSALSTANYDSLLIGWSGQIVQQDVWLGVGSTQYSVDGQSARDVLVNTYGWTITDGGYVCTENWIANYTECIADQHIKYYTDENNCGTTVNLPVDNGTSPLIYPWSWGVSCITGSANNQALNVNGIRLWALQQPYSADNFSFYSTNSNVINVYNESNDLVLQIGGAGNNPGYAGGYDGVVLPTGTYHVDVINYWYQMMTTSYTGIQLISTHIYCTENWNRIPASCTGSNTDYIIQYIDTNNCGTIINLPSDNNTIITCQVNVGGGGSTNINTPVETLTQTPATLSIGGTGGTGNSKVNIIVASIIGVGLLFYLLRGVRLFK
jgi:hypothetical protein